MSSSPKHEIALSVERVSKCYHIYRRPQDRLRQTLFRHRRKYFSEFWALRDVNIEIRRGEAVGILGRNGAGKSTLLEIISGTLSPTHGRVVCCGRISPLLQLGAGFHGEYTGRENVFLSGAISGIPRSDMAERFAEIADFADIGHYVDQPVKTYSSGMHARLAFAVAMAVEPEILIVDEILAVGDLLFQQKCVSRIMQMRERGMTLLFVSHSVDRVKGLCQRGLYLKAGEQAFWGDVEQCANRYLADLRTEIASPKPSKRKQQSVQQSALIDQQTRGLFRYGSQEVRIVDVRVLNAEGEPTTHFNWGEEIRVEADVVAEINASDLNISYLIRDETGVDLMGTMSHDEQVEIPDVEPGSRRRIRFAFENHLRPGTFGVSVAVTQLNRKEPRRPRLFDQIDGAQGFTVLASPTRPVHYKFYSEHRVTLL